MMKYTPEDYKTNARRYFHFGTKAQFRREVITGYKKERLLLQDKVQTGRVLHMTLESQKI